MRRHFSFSLTNEISREYLNVAEAAGVRLEKDWRRRLNCYKLASFPDYNVTLQFTFCQQNVLCAWEIFHGRFFEFNRASKQPNVFACYDRKTFAEVCARVAADIGFHLLNEGHWEGRSRINQLSELRRRNFFPSLATDSMHRTPFASSTTTTTHTASERWEANTMVCVGGGRRRGETGVRGWEWEEEGERGNLGEEEEFERRLHFGLQVDPYPFRGFLGVIWSHLWLAAGGIRGDDAVQLGMSGDSSRSLLEIEGGGLFLSAQSAP